MKVRLISAGIALIVLATVLFFYETILLDLVLAALSGIAVYELLHSTKLVKNPVLLAVSCVYAVVFPLTEAIPAFKENRLLLTLVGIAISVGVMLFRHEKVLFTELSTAMFGAGGVAFCFSSTLWIRENEHAFFYTILLCIAAWLTDTGAYFTGRFFGRHKLAPVLSPNKTVEGAIGGVAVTVIAFPLLTLWYCQSNGLTFSVLPCMLMGLLGALVGMAGDLFASAIKRQAGIKDYGNIMPGHGGVLDRFDSFLFISPLFYLLIPIFSFIG